MARILVVEDSPEIAELIAPCLQRAGHAVTALSTGAEVMAEVLTNRPDLVVLDRILPGLDGLVVCQTLRNHPTTAAVPIIMVTARGEEADRVTGLEFGADDYVTKPFSPKELVARVAALLRRVERSAPTSTILDYGRVTVDVDRHRVRLDETEVRLTAKEFLLLRYLIEHRGHVLSRDVLLSDVWGYHYTGGTRHGRRARASAPREGSATGQGDYDRQADRLPTRGLTAAAVTGWPGDGRES